ncbi:hypothetical protein ACIBHX_28415 [Nonomuraea sp. NPDC050536]|uniref:hypothetical protein n=1 Tax=Nonomuraea sp. NPDC050536 TaxID=3364366 RepID=UPI0037C5EA0B
MFAANRLAGASLAMVLASTTLTLTMGTGTAAVAASQSAARASATVRLVDGHIGLSQRIFHHGSVTFTIRNAGTVVHGFAIAGRGVSARSSFLRPGGSTTLTVRLHRGRYAVWCPVDGHRFMGMWTWIGVR